MTPRCRDDAVYWLMQASLLLTALALWRAVRAAALTSGIAALLATMVQMGLLGALLTFAGAPLYAPHLVGADRLGLVAARGPAACGSDHVGAGGGSLPRRGAGLA